jgi:hypothetical protein
MSRSQPENPAINIINPSPYSSGWLSIPNSPLPQDLILDFGSVISLTHLQFVSHQNKIASHITLFTTRDSNTWGKAKFQQIDTFQVSDNRQRDYKSRELRSGIVSNIRLRFLRFRSMKSIKIASINKTKSVSFLFVQVGFLKLLPFVVEKFPFLSMIQRAKMILWSQIA